MPDLPAADTPGLSRDELLLEEYRANREFVARNEAAGETRVNLLLTLNAGLVAVLTLGSDSLFTPTGGPGAVGPVLLLVALLLVGRTVLVRTVRRNLATTRVLHEVDRIRAELARRHPDVQSFLVWNPKDPKDLEEAAALPGRREVRFRDFLLPARGGLVELVALLNASLCGALAGVVALRLAPADDPVLVAGAAAVAGFLGGWAWHVHEVNARYRAAHAEKAPSAAPVEAPVLRTGPA